MQKLKKRKIKGNSRLSFVDDIEDQSEEEGGLRLKFPFLFIYVAFYNIIFFLVKITPLCMRHPENGEKKSMLYSERAKRMVLFLQKP